MNVGVIKRRVKRQFGDTSGAQITDEDIIDWINQGMVDIVRRTECLVSHRQASVVQNDPSYTLPPDVLFIQRVTLDGNTLASTSQQSIDYLGRDTDNAGAGTPYTYFLSGNVINLYPKPSVDGNDNLDIFYVRMPTEVAVDNDVPEIPLFMHEDIIRYCLARAKELDDDLEGAAALGQEYDSRMNNALFEIKGQPADSYPSVRVLPGDWGEGGW